MSKSATMLFPSSASTCPSELLFDRWHVGELDPEKAETIAAHVGACTGCTARLDLRRGGFGAMGVDEERLLRRIEAAKPNGLRTKFDEFFATIGWRAPLVAAALAAALILIPDQTQPEVRSKGATSLRVFRERGGIVEETMTGDRFAPHDRIRFDVAVSDGSQIMVVGVEDSGDVFTYYPTNRDGSARVLRRPDGALVGAIELDDYEGREWLHLVRCDREFGRADLELRPGRLGVHAPEECDVSAFEMQRGDE